MGGVREKRAGSKFLSQLPRYSARKQKGLLPALFTFTGEDQHVDKGASVKNSACSGATNTKTAQENGAPPTAISGGILMFGGMSCFTAPLYFYLFLLPRHLLAMLSLRPVGTLAGAGFHPPLPLAHPVRSYSMFDPGRLGRKKRRSVHSLEFSVDAAVGNASAISTFFTGKDLS